MEFKTAQVSELINKLEKLRYIIGYGGRRGVLFFQLFLVDLADALQTLV